MVRPDKNMNEMGTYRVNKVFPEYYGKKTLQPLSYFICFSLEYSRSSCRIHVWWADIQSSFQLLDATCQPLLCCSQLTSSSLLWWSH